ncbi:MAG: TM2 domain-containing protein [Bacteroidetes bacterium]|uniref:TM2 domain-containing protein n=1 Tax=Candidatus Cryptobacteroides excrementipullorum TaxID=2840761 RepID=A0A9D9IRS6_9BACT|nr:TM2 domain-containing protein [Candidatus Cryptobacteroides excrementipullorum]
MKDVYCPNCGTKVPENVRFCPKCGREICQSGNRTGQKDKLVAGLLAIFLGYLGIHYFYLGKTTGGIITIVLSLCTCGLWSVVTLIQGILMLVSTDEAFAEKYVDNDRKFPLF